MKKNLFLIILFIVIFFAAPSAHAATKKCGQTLDCLVQAADVCAPAAGMISFVGDTFFVAGDMAQATTVVSVTNITPRYNACQATYQFTKQQFAYTKKAQGLLRNIGETPVGISIDQEKINDRVADTILKQTVTCSADTGFRLAAFFQNFVTRKNTDGDCRSIKDFILAGDTTVVSRCLYPEGVSCVTRRW